MKKIFIIVLITFLFSFGQQNKLFSMSINQRQEKIAQLIEKIEEQEERRIIELNETIEETIVSLTALSEKIRERTQSLQPENRTDFIKEITTNLKFISMPIMTLWIQAFRERLTQDQ